VFGWLFFRLLCLGLAILGVLNINRARSIQRGGFKHIISTEASVLNQAGNQNDATQRRPLCFVPEPCLASCFFFCPRNNHIGFGPNSDRRVPDISTETHYPLPTTPAILRRVNDPAGQSLRALFNAGPQDKLIVMLCLVNAIFQISELHQSELRNMQRRCEICIATAVI